MAFCFFAAVCWFLVYLTELSRPPLLSIRLKHGSLFLPNLANTAQTIDMACQGP